MPRWDDYEVNLSDIEDSGLSASEPSFVHSNLRPRIERIDDLYARYKELEGSSEMELMEVFSDLMDEIRVYFVMANAGFHQNIVAIFYHEMIHPDHHSSEVSDVITRIQNPHTFEELLNGAGVLSEEIVEDIQKFRGKRNDYAHEVMVDIEWNDGLRKWALRAAEINEILYDAAPHRRRVDELEYDTGDASE